MTVAKMLNEWLQVSSLDPIDEKIYWLIDRYKGKVSDRLLKKKEALLVEGKRRFGEQLVAKLMVPNPFLTILPNYYSGAYVPPPPRSDDT